jgi:hypothetical protein
MGTQHERNSTPPIARCTNRQESAVRGINYERRGTRRAGKNEAMAKSELVQRARVGINHFSAA